MLDRLKLIESKYQEINEKLSDPEVVKDVKNVYNNFSYICNDDSSRL